MKWSLRVARLAGVSIYVHITFLLLPLWAAVSQYSVRKSLGDAYLGVAFILVLFGIVVLHELGHAVAAKRFGIGTRDITLLPIGGVARLERIPEKPKEELAVALAGPAVNVCLAAFFFAVQGLGSQIAELTNLDLVQSNFLSALMWVNVGLVIFNLIPAFPMDGGRVLRALLAFKLNYLSATNTAAAIGQGIALLFGFVGLASIFFGHLGPISNPFLLLVGLFVWLGARQEAGIVRMKLTLGGIAVSRLLMTDFRVLPPHQSLAQAAELLQRSVQRDFPVVEDGRLVGLLTEDAIVHGLAQRGKWALVGDLMARDFSTIDPEEPAEKAFLLLRTGQAQTLLAVREGLVHGLLTQEQLRRFLLIQATIDPHSDNVRVDQRQAA